jgi:hypothetical protein
MYGIVPSGFNLGVIVPLIKNPNDDISSKDNYRGITLSPVVSKLFEIVIIEIAKCKLISSDLQFGFKPKSSCSHAVACLRAVVKHYNNSGSTVTLCALDISKAFDRVDHYKLMSMLIQRHFPRCIIDVLLNWFNNCCSCVRWGDAMSSVFPVISGVRQGGVLSPLLFAIFMDNLINRLQISGLGCVLNQTYFGCLIYADDIMLISQSVVSMQKMLNICDEFANDVDVKFNTTKSSAMRIGDRFKVNCAPLILAGNHLQYVKEFKYLGVNIVSGRGFRTTFDHVKVKFYRTFNAILSKSRASNSELISVQLLKSYCLPFLTYACEALCLAKTELKSLDRCMRLSISKIFGMLSNDNIDNVYDMLCLPMITDIYNFKKQNLIGGLLCNDYYKEIIPILYDELY